MGKLSDIYKSYQKSLDTAQNDYEDSVRMRSDNAKKFYDDFFKDLIVNLGKQFASRDFRSGIIDQIRAFFGKTELNFVAIDGSCDKHDSNEFISFYGGAYGAKGTLSLSVNSAKISYKRWEIEKDVSMVAFVPVPYSQLTEVTDPRYEESFFASEFEKVQMSGIHLPIMQLAEIYLAYNSATNSNLDRPDLIMLDNTISDILGQTDFNPEKIGLIGYPFETRTLDIADAAVAQAHPFNSKLGVPSTKIFSLGFTIVKFFHENQSISEITIPDLENALGFKMVSRHFSRIARLEEHGIIKFDQTEQKIVRVGDDPWKRWEYVKYFFQTICKGIFLDKRENALKYNTKDNDGNEIARWMSPKDIQFLIAVGLRALIEACWEKKILLVGVVKDSGSRYLTRNYLGVCKILKKYPALSSLVVGSLPPTDRLCCELLPYIDESLQGPWGTIEFDSTFMTLKALPDESGKLEDSERIVGAMESITRPERLLMRSIAQFYTKRTENNLLTGHAIFLDRLVFPDLDIGRAEDFEVEGKHVGKLIPMIYKDRKRTNVGQIITYFLLDTVTRNHYPEVIGYPEPLHKADSGAKAMMRNVKQLLQSSELKFRSRPLTKTLRQIRESARR